MLGSVGSGNSKKSHRNKGALNAILIVKAPFPWMGGKRLVAAEVWARLGDVAVYAEPFAGSLAVLLGRPDDHAGYIETVNDLDGFISNAWRAILQDPDATAHHVDWPAHECDLHARHAWLTERRAELRARLEGDPDYHDPKIAGWWLWGLSQWIGGEFCSGAGPWHRTEVAPGDWQLLRAGDGDGGVRRRRPAIETGRGVNRKIVHLGNGRGVSRQIVYLGAAVGVQRNLVHLGDAGRGVSRQIGTAWRGVKSGDGEQGLLEWLRALSERLRRVRVCCGDWARVLTPSALAPGVPGPRGIFLDPPYGVEDRKTCYSEDSRDVAQDVREWCLQHGTLPTYRIALCGYAGEGHEALEDAGWSVHVWKAHGGMQRDKSVSSTTGAGGNRTRERIWFSPACLAVAQDDLFSVAAQG